MKKFLDALWAKIQRQPAVLLSLLGAGFAMFASFGLALSEEQTASVTAFVIVLLGFLTRAAVTPNVSVAAKEAAPPAAENVEAELVAGEASDVLTGAPVDVVATSDPRAYAEEALGDQPPA